MAGRKAGAHPPARSAGEAPLPHEPSGLSEAERAVFLRLVNACDREHFTASDLPLLVAYCQAVTQHDRAAQAIRREGDVVNGRLSPWIVVQEKAVWDRGEATLVVEDRATPVPHQLQRTAAKEWQGALGDFAPIRGKLLFAGRDGIGQELQDVFARNTAAPLAALRPSRRGRRLHGGKIVAEALEYCLAQKAVVGNAAVFDFRLDDGLDPRRFRFLRRHRQRRAVDYERIEPFAHFARDRLGIAAARLLVRL
jgi:hypothetical protein